MHALNARGLTFHGPALNGQTAVRFDAPSGASFTFGNDVKLEADTALKTTTDVDISTLADVVADLVPAPTAAGTFIDNQAGEILAAVTADQLHTHLRYGLQDASLPEPAKAELTQRVDLTKGVPVDLDLTGIDPGTYDVYFYLVSDATTKESALEGELDLVVT